MSGFDLVTKIFGVGGVQAFEKTLAGKGISFTKDAMADAFRKAFGGAKIPLEEVGGKFIVTDANTFGFHGGQNGFPKKCSMQKPLFSFSNRGERLNLTADEIAEKMLWMVDSAVRQSNPKIVNSISETTKLALAA